MSRMLACRLQARRGMVFARPVIQPFSALTRGPARYAAQQGMGNVQRSSRLQRSCVVEVMPPRAPRCSFRHACTVRRFYVYNERENGAQCSRSRQRVRA